MLFKHIKAYVFADIIKVDLTATLKPATARDRKTTWIPTRFVEYLYSILFLLMLLHPFPFSGPHLPIFGTRTYGGRGK